MKRKAGEKFGDDIDDRILLIVFTVIFHLISWLTQLPSVIAIFR